MISSLLSTKMIYSFEIHQKRVLIMTIQIKEVTSLKELKTFIRFPFKLYRDNPFWVPSLMFDELNTLRRDKNPAFEYCDARFWLAYKDEHIVGRVAAILNRRHIE